MDTLVIYAERTSRDPKSGMALVARLVLAVWLTGCAAQNFSPPPKRIVQSPSPYSGKHELKLIIRAMPPVGGVLPVQMAVGGINRRVSLDEQGKVKVVEKSFWLNEEKIRAETTSGTTVAVLTPDQAIEAAGGAQALVNALSRPDMVHISGYEKEPGRAMMAAQACLLPFSSPGMFAAGYPPGGLAVGWIFMVCPLIAGGTAAKSIAVASSPSMQVSDLALSGGGLGLAAEKSGYIFLPRGNYKAIEVPVEVEEGNTRSDEIRVQAWDSAGDLAGNTLNSGSITTPASQQQSKSASRQ